MKPHPERKIPLLITLVVFVFFSVVLTITLSAGDIDHECTEHNCHICLKIETAKSFIKTLKLASHILLLTGCLLFFAGIYNNHTGHKANLLSPVVLKVRYNS